MEITEKIEIENILMATNKEKFRQENDTPFQQEPWRSIVGTGGLTNDCDKILLGVLELPPDCPQGIIDFINAVKMDDMVLNDKLVCPDISTEEHIKFWSKARGSPRNPRYQDYILASTKPPQNVES